MEHNSSLREWRRLFFKGLPRQGKRSSFKTKHFYATVLGLASLTLLLFFQNCSKIDFDHKAVWQQSSVAAYQLQEDEGPKKFNLPELQVPMAYRMIVDGQEVEPSNDRVVLNGKLLAFDKKTGEFTYQANPDYHGEQVFEFEVQDTYSKAWSHYAATLVVTPVNDAPTAKDALVSPKLNQAMIVPISVFNPTDVDGDRLTLSLLDPENKPINEISRDSTTVRIVSDDNTKLEVLVQAFKGALSIPVRISDGTSEGSLDVHLVVSPESPLLDFKPALAVNKTYCLFCHAQISGNLVTTLGASNGKKDISFFDGALSSTMSFGDYKAGNWTDHNAMLFALSNFINGNVYLPRSPLDTKAKDYAAATFKDATETRTETNPTTGATFTLPVMDFTGFTQKLGLDLSRPQTGGQYMYAVNRLRTPQYIDRLKNYGQGKTLTPDTKIREISSVTITAPAIDLLRTKLRTNETVSFYPQDLNQPNLINFGLQKARVIDGVQKWIWGNKAGEISQCDGDVFVDGPVFLNQLKLKTRFGCRIHATGTIFVSGNLTPPPGATNPNIPRGFILVDSAEQSVLELSSSSAITLGLGGAYLRERIKHAHNLQPPASVINDTYFLVADSITANDPALINDAAVSGRLVAFERILVNAPIIHSRYTGDFKGVVIADFVLWSLGKFKYFYDNIFDKVPIFPMLTPSDFFEVKQCPADKVIKRDDHFNECQP